MKNLILTIAFIFLTGVLIGQTTYCVSFENASLTPDGTKLELEIYASGSANFLLGNSNFQFSFDELALADPEFVSSPQAIPFYQVPTVSNPAVGVASLNIIQAFDGLGTVVTTAPVLMGRVSFDVIDPSLLANFNWNYSGSTTQTVVFDDNTPIFVTTNNDACLMPLENVALPIRLKSFTAVPYQNIDANLDWITATEVNASHFEIERSDDGIDFTNIGRVEAVGSSTTDQSYEFSDREVNMERNDVVHYYRIKMVDLDGEYKYSGVRVVNFTRSDIDFAINAYPNPTVNYVQLNLTGVDNTSTERPTLSIYSNTGELIRSEELNSDLGRVDMTDFPSSLYHFIIDYKGQRYTEKIALIK